MDPKGIDPTELHQELEDYAKRRSKGVPKCILQRTGAQGQPYEELIPEGHEQYEYWKSVHNKFGVRPSPGLVVMHRGADGRLDKGIVEAEQAEEEYRKALSELKERYRARRWERRREKLGEKKQEITEAIKRCSIM